MKYFILCTFLIVLCISVSVEAGERLAMSQSYLLDSLGNNAPNLEIDLPNKWEYTKHKGPDFDVHWLTSPEGTGGIGIYVGHHPSFKEDISLSNMKRFVGGKEARFYPEKKNGTTLFHAVVDGFFEGFSGAGVSSLKLHVMINETKSGFAEEAFEYLKTLRTKGRPR